jgi:hypothetical protein
MGDNQELFLRYEPAETCYDSDSRFELDTRGYGCEWYRIPFSDNSQKCGKYDVDADRSLDREIDFEAGSLCCDCGGGRTVSEAFFALQCDDCYEPIGFACGQVTCPREVGRYNAAGTAK